MAQLYTPVRATEKSERSRQAVAIVANAVANCRSIKYDYVGDADYKWWISVCANTPDNRKLAEEVKLRLLSTTDVRFVALWQMVCTFLEADCRDDCTLLVDNFFRTYTTNFNPSRYTTGTFHKVLLAAAHPYQFNDKKMSEVL